MKLSISNIAWNQQDDIKIYGFMKQLGFSGLEIAPTRMIQQDPYQHITEAREKAERIKRQYGFAISSMQSILFGRQERLFGSLVERNLLKNYMKKAVDFAVAIKCRNLVFGSPKNRITGNPSDYNIAVDFFSGLGEYAKINGTYIAIEANPVIYGTNFINTTDEAFAFVKSVQSDGVKVNLDFGTIVENNENMAQISTNMELINHIHISEPWLAPIKKREQHQRLFEICQDKNYTGYISIEMKRDSISVLHDAMLYISDIYRQFGGVCHG